LDAKVARAREVFDMALQLDLEGCCAPLDLTALKRLANAYGICAQYDNAVHVLT